MRFSTLTAIGFAVLLAGGATAADTTSVSIPDAYRIGRTPVAIGAQGLLKSGAFTPERAASFERQLGAGLDGAFYAEVFPIFTGADGNTSYLRLGAGDAASTFHVTVVGSPSGDIYG